MKNKNSYTFKEVGSMVSMAYNLGIAVEQKRSESGAEPSSRILRKIKNGFEKQVPQNVRDGGVCPIQSILDSLE
tara:strand:- start:668 stop:889 length:222 start_codon:yes stop_codon:yes gene_type:complete